MRSDVIEPLVNREVYESREVLPAGQWSRALFGGVDPPPQAVVSVVAAGMERWLVEQFWRPSSRPGLRR